MLKLKLQYFGHWMQRTDSLEKTLMLGKTEGKRKRGQQRMRCWMVSPTQWSWISASSGRQWRTGKLGMLQSMGSQRVGYDLATEQQPQQSGDNTAPHWLLQGLEKKWKWGLNGRLTGGYEFLVLKEKEVPSGESPDAEVKVGSYSAENISSL